MRQRHAALLGDDLLRAERDRDRLLGRQRERLVEEFVCSDCAPPSTAASACSATRTTLFNGCCAVSDTPAVCACVRSCIDSGFFAPKRSLMSGAQIRRAARNFAISSKKSLWTSKKKREARREVVDVEAALDAAST